MIGNPIEKRKAERFDELLSEAGSRRRRHKTTTHDDTLRPLVEVGKTLQATATDLEKSSRPDSEFAAQLRQRLMAVATVQGIGVGSESEALGRKEEQKQPARRKGRKRLIAATTVTIGLLALTGISSASGNAIPGEPLYPVKRSTESAQLALAGSDSNRGQLHFEFATNRLYEAIQIGDDAEALDVTLADMDDELRWGMQSMTLAAINHEDTSVLDTVDEFLVEHRAAVSAFASDLSDESYEHIDDSLELINDAGERSSQLRLALPCTDSADLISDDLGALPGQCHAEPGPQQPAPSDSPQNIEEPTPGTQPTSDAPSSNPPSTEPSDAPSSDKPDDEKEEDGGLLSAISDLLSGLFG